MPPSLKRTLFALFVVSGFCGLVYQIIWVRMALASFGVITPFVSVVVSVYMLGLAVGTWLGGRWGARLDAERRRSAAACYGLAEIGIGLSAFVVPGLFALGRQWLLPFGELASVTYLLLSSIVILVAILPWCVCMGATFPLMMAFVKQVDSSEGKSFSYLYLANVIGAMLGTLVTCIALIELYGFRGSLAIAGVLNFTIAATAFLLARAFPVQRGTGTMMAAEGAVGTPTAATGTREATSRLLVVLFTTGFASMAMEIVWLRALTPVIGTMVYAFAGLLATYLLATWLGSFVYRVALARGAMPGTSGLIALAAFTGLLPVLVVDPGVLPALAVRLGSILPGPAPFVTVLVALASIAPFCAVLGFLTPMLVDRHSAGAPGRAGSAYAVNIVGSILGPLAAAYLLLPWLGARLAMLVLGAPFLVLLLWSARRSESRWGWPRTAVTCAIALAGFGHGLVTSRSYEEGHNIRGAVVRRDHTATVTSYGRGFQRGLLVNGRGMTVLNSVTKMMAHLPLATLERPPSAALVIAFGMGTTYRSLLTWDIETTAVELVPSVVDAFGYYFDDAEQVASDPRGTIIIDDGRRFLARSQQTFDLIVIDPPPPVETAGSSLLYSREFCELVARRLKPGGIFQAWFPRTARGETDIARAVVRTCTGVFPHVRVFQSINGEGLHILCSAAPIAPPHAGRLAGRIPEPARRDLLEWVDPPQALVPFVQEWWVDKELDVSTILAPGGEAVITDDRPFNEYYLLRLVRGA